MLGKGHDEGVDGEGGAQVHDVKAGVRVGVRVRARVGGGRRGLGSVRTAPTAQAGRCSLGARGMVESTGQQGAYARGVICTRTVTRGGLGVEVGGWGWGGPNGGFRAWGCEGRQRW